MTENNQPTGLDSSNVPAIDPTKNVLDLVNATIKRLDDVAELRGTIADIKNTHIKELSELRAAHQIAIDALESKRLDAVRVIDQQSLRNESDRAATAIATLATSAVTTAETLRNAVNTSAANLATQQDRTVTVLSDRISQLEKSSYKGEGKQALADPQIEHLSKLVEELTISNSQRIGKTEGISVTTSTIVIVIGLLISVIALYFKPSSISVQPAQPQIIYMPAPSGTMIPSPPTRP